MKLNDLRAALKQQQRRYGNVEVNLVTNETAYPIGDVIGERGFFGEDPIVEIVAVERHES